MRELNEFGHEFGPPGSVFRQHNSLTENRFDMTAKPCGLTRGATTYGVAGKGCCAVIAISRYGGHRFWIWLRPVKRVASASTLSGRSRSTCVCRKLRFEHIADVTRRPWHEIRCVRSAEPGARRVHPCPMNGAFARCCNSSRKILGLGANVVRPIR